MEGLRRVRMHAQSSQRELFRPVERCLLCDESLAEGEGERRMTRGGTVFYVHASCRERVQRHGSKGGPPSDEEEKR